MYLVGGSIPLSRFPPDFFRVAFASASVATHISEISHPIWRGNSYRTIRLHVVSTYQVTQVFRSIFGLGLKFSQVARFHCCELDHLRLLEVGQPLCFSWPHLGPTNLTGRCDYRGLGLARITPVAHGTRKSGPSKSHLGPAARRRLRGPPNRPTTDAPDGTQHQAKCH